MHNHNPNESKARAIFRVVSGNFLEMYDFMVYGYYPRPLPTPSSQPVTSSSR